MKITRSAIVLMVILIYGCKNKKSDTKDISLSNTKDSVIKPLHDSTANLLLSEVYLKVSAHLIYNDETLSTFDVLNDKSIALWNVIAGGGDALKPSASTKISIDGAEDSLSIKIRNGSKVVIDTSIIHFEKSLEYTVRNTGCAVIDVKVTRNKKLIYNDSIPFHCGE